ncbi:hypothetical protein [Lapidilactobacillus luobeiensis]|uniref:hypothetical protein n=1 Tax=Lapidilactobacillus luobeiensis TaxID=2950371 RepID=UPI0021C2EFE5|nr:hypothetical protein [Lapidilactobacillus luobeiensis]
MLNCRYESVDLMMTEKEIVKAIINFILTNPGVVREPRVYINQITFAFADSLPVPGDATFFPEMRLHVFRLTPEFVRENQDLLQQLFVQTEEGRSASYDQVWFTSSHLTDRRLNLVEFSFE